MSKYEVLKIDDLDRIPVSGADVTWRPVRRRLGITAFGINAYTGEPGENVVEKHDEERLGHEELYVVISGRARFELDGESVDAPAGTLVFLSEPAVRRHAVAEEPGTTVLAIGGKPGAARDVRLGVLLRRVFPRRTGRPRRARIADHERRARRATG